MGFTCNSARDALEYDLYVMYPVRGLLDDYGMFRDAIVSMLRPEDMEQNGYLVRWGRGARGLEIVISVWCDGLVISG